ncbi:MAG: hypothetical protein HC847_29115 [Hydrococcus sp. RU_2_2]|nr:hypothetical protein [Hydrococcus sp. RU_2_2]
MRHHAIAFIPLVLEWKLKSAISWGAYIDAIVCVHKIALEDFESYAVYDPNLLSIAIAFITLKPVEYIVKIAICSLILRVKGD